MSALNRISAEEVHDLAIEQINKRIYARANAVMGLDATQRSIYDLRNAVAVNKGWTKGRNMRWVARIPIEAWQYACTVYGKDALIQDKKLFNKVFKDVMLVNPNTAL